MGIIMAALIAFDPNKYELGHMVWWVPLACYTAIALGTMSGGWKIVKTMGSRITKVTPFEGWRLKQPVPSRSSSPNP